LFDNYTYIFNATMRMIFEEESHNHEYAKILELVTRQKCQIENLEMECTKCFDKG